MSSLGLFTNIAGFPKSEKLLNIILKKIINTQMCGIEDALQ